MIPIGQSGVVLAVAGEWLDFLFYGSLSGRGPAYGRPGD